MDYFETPSWEVENETEKWASDLFATSNIKHSKVPKKRKRNKYPKGFNKTNPSEPVEESKDESTMETNYVKPENLEKYSCDISSPKGKRKKKCSEKYKVEKGACKSSSKIGEVGGNSTVKGASSSVSKPSVSTTPKLSPKKKKKKSSLRMVFESSSAKGGGINENSTDENSSSNNFKPSNSTAPKLNSKKKKKKSNLVNVDKTSSTKYKEISENPIAVDGLTTILKPKLSTIPKLSPKKKKKKSNLVNIDETSSTKCKDIGASPIAVDGLTTILKPKLSTIPKLSPKKKKKKSSSGESKMKEINDLNSLKKLQNQLDLNLSGDFISEGRKYFGKNNDTDSKNKIKKSKKSNKTAKRPRIVTNENEQSEEDNTKQYSEPSNVVGKKRKHHEEEVVSKKKRKKLRKIENECTEQDIPEDSEIQIFSGHTNGSGFVKQEPSFQGSETIKSNAADVSASPGMKKKKLSLREKMEEKLRGARFRFLNEQLYTSKSKDTNKFFLLDRKAFEAYHEGYKQQLMQWPVKPIDLIIKSLRKKPASYVIADFGCGDAKLAQSLPNEVHSFDHVALNNHVTVCDVAHTPLTKGSVDIVVFCLSLMGSNLSDYIAEANRVLKIGGILKIAEVESRFDDVDKFVQLICKFGFLCIRQDSSHDYFCLFDFQKEKNLKEGKTLPSIELRACCYKKR